MRSWVLALALLGSAQEQRKPNILVIVADDLGYGDLGAQGGKDIPTPNIDSIAAGGVRCTNAYVSCAVCSPTRAGLMTGRYQQRFGHEFNPGPQEPENFGLPLTEVTLADRLKAAGYATGMVGKWHLGGKPAYHPVKRGFDEYFGFLGGGHSYLQAGATVLRGTEPAGEKEYLTDAFGREAAAFVDRHASKPFFLYLTFNAVHTPMQAAEKYLKRFEAIAEPKRRTYAAMLSAMDDAVGAVLERIRAAGIEERTLVLFVSDNGGPTGANASRNDPLSGVKGSLWEGGIRVPLFVKWKGRLPAGKTYDAPVIALDIHPTAVAAAGGEMPKDKVYDGVNLLPHLDGTKADAPHEALFWRFNATAVRKGGWKLLKNAGEAPKLFDLSADIAEKKDLAAEKPELVKELSDVLAKWEAGLMQPLWGRPARGKGKGKGK